jgi:hypothetical protein
MPDDPPRHEASILIEQEGASKFKIQSDQLEQIGAQLRGRRTFSIFHSIVLPLIVSVATIVFSSVFQWVSWFNSVNVTYATDVADRAARAYENSAAAIGTRHYAMLVFLPALRDLVQAKANANAVLSARAQAHGRGIKDRNIAYYPQTTAKKRNPDAEQWLLSSIVTQSTEGTKDNEILLHKSDLDVKQKRFASYYEQLKLWNENYDHQLSEIEYALDRPVFLHAHKNVSFRVSRQQISKINCSNSLTQELQKQNLNSYSLKFMFAGIHNCFMEVHHLLDGQLTAAISNPSPDFTKSTESKIKDQLGSLLEMENEFRCYAHRRIDYYNNQKELAIFSMTYVWRGLTDATKTEALTHFEDAAVGCV